MPLLSLPTADLCEYLTMLRSRRLATLALGGVLLYSLTVLQQGTAAVAAGVSEDAAADPRPAAPACPSHVTSTLDLPNVPACRQLLTMMEDTQHGCASLKPYTDPDDPLSTCAYADRPCVTLHSNTSAP